MSILRLEDVTCPFCAETVSLGIARSVNADRRPDLRAAILDGTFQRETCPHCQTPFRVEPQITYLDSGRHQWILASAAADLTEWGTYEAQARAAFLRSYGPDAGEVAQEIGAGISPRLVFGWTAMFEKLVCAEAGLDDATLELLKLSIIRSEDGAFLDDETDLRLLEVRGDTLVLGLVRRLNETLVERIEVPRGSYDAIAQAPDSWAALRAELTEGPLVDLNRLLIPPGTAPEAAEAASA